MYQNRLNEVLRAAKLQRLIEQRKAQKKLTVIGSIILK